MLEKSILKNFDKIPTGASIIYILRENCLDRFILAFSILCRYFTPVYVSNFAGESITAPTSAKKLHTFFQTNV